MRLGAGEGVSNFLDQSRWWKKSNSGSETADPSSLHNHGTSGHICSLPGTSGGPLTPPPKHQPLQELGLPLEAPGQHAEPTLRDQVSGGRRRAS